MKIMLVGFFLFIELLILTLSFKVFENRNDKPINNFIRNVSNASLIFTLLTSVNVMAWKVFGLWNLFFV